MTSALVVPAWGNSTLSRFESRSRRPPTSTTVCCATGSGRLALRCRLGGLRRLRRLGGLGGLLGGPWLAAARAVAARGLVLAVGLLARRVGGGVPAPGRLGVAHAGLERRHEVDD